MKSRSGELIVVDGERKDVKFVRTVKRIPEEHRWDSNNWVDYGGSVEQTRWRQ